MSKTRIGELIAEGTIHQVLDCAVPLTEEEPTQEEIYLSALFPTTMNFEPVNRGHAVAARPNLDAYDDTHV